VPEVNRAAKLGTVIVRVSTRTRVIDGHSIDFEERSPLLGERGLQSRRAAATVGPVRER